MAARRRSPQRQHWPATGAPRLPRRRGGTGRGTRRAHSLGERHRRVGGAVPPPPLPGGRRRPPGCCACRGPAGCGLLLAAPTSSPSSTVSAFSNMLARSNRASATSASLSVSCVKNIGSDQVRGCRRADDVVIDTQVEDAQLALFGTGAGLGTGQQAKWMLKQPPGVTPSASV